MRKTANLMIIRGAKGFPGYPSEIMGESWSKLEHQAYVGMIPLPPPQDDPLISRITGAFEVVALIPGREPMKGLGVFYRGCTGMALPQDIAEVLV